MAEFTSTSGFLQTQGAPLYYEVAGQGYPLLLVHAGVANNQMWDEQFPVFAEHYRAIRFDLRGFGQSQYPAQAFANHEDPAELLKFLGEKKAHVVGVSFGSRTVLDFALTHPEMIASLVLVAPAVSGYPRDSQLQKFFEGEDALLEQGDVEGATELNLRMWVDGPKRTADQVDAVVRQRVHDMQFEAMGNQVPEGAEDIQIEPPAYDRLGEIKVPTLVIVGDYDLPTKVETAHYLAKHIAGAQLEIFPGVAHMVSMEEPEKFKQVVLDFLSKQ